jgi:hypothetical protein
MKRRRTVWPAPRRSSNRISCGDSKRAYFGARRLGGERQAELNRLHAEFSSLPERISNTQRELDSLNTALSELNVEILKADYKSLFRTILDGGRTDQLALVFSAAAIVTCDLRREVLTEKAGEIEASLVEMRRRNKELKRKLS